MYGYFLGAGEILARFRSQFVQDCQCVLFTECSSLARLIPGNLEYDISSTFLTTFNRDITYVLISLNQGPLLFNFYELGHTQYIVWSTRSDKGLLSLVRGKKIKNNKKKS